MSHKPSEPCVLSIDIGTSSIRSCLIDATGAIADNTLFAIEHSPTTTPDGGSELDPEEAFTKVCAVIDKSLSAAREYSVLPAAVAMTSFWHSLMGIDHRGKAITPVYLWADTRSAPYVEQLRYKASVDEIYKRNGCPLHSSYWPSKLLWLRDSQPELYSQVDKWLSFAEYVQLRFTGELRCAHGMASGTGIYLQRDMSWDPFWIDLLDLRESSLPRLTSLREPLGYLRDSDFPWKDLAGIPWYPAVGDGACSNIGSGAFDSSKVAINFGTSGAIRIVVDQYLEPPYGLWLYRIDNDRLLFGGALSNAGNIYEWLTETLRISHEQAEQCLLTIQKVKPGLVFEPYLAGERSPRWRPDATGTIRGLRLDTKPEDIFKAGMLGVLYEFAKVHDMLDNSLGSDDRVTILSGGAIIKSQALRKALSEVLRRPTMICLEEEPSARGAALLVLEAIGAVKELKDAPARLVAP